MLSCIRNTTKFLVVGRKYFAILVILFNSILQNRKIQIKKKRSAYGKTYATTALCTKVLSCIRNTTKFMVFWPEIFRSSPYRSFIIQFNLAKSESSKKKVLMEKTTEQLLSIQLSSHTFVTAQTLGLLRLLQSSQTLRSHPVSMLMTALVSQVKVCALLREKHQIAWPSWVCLACVPSAHGQ